MESKRLFPAEEKEELYREDKLPLGGEALPEERGAPLARPSDEEGIEVGLFKDTLIIELLFPPFLRTLMASRAAMRAFSKELILFRAFESSSFSNSALREADSPFSQIRRLIFFASSSSLSKSLDLFLSWSSCTWEVKFL